jgi:hypothetical protein
MNAWKYGLLVLLAACGSSSASDERLAHIEAKVDSIQKTTRGIPALLLYQSPLTEYTLSDLSRDAKKVGTFTTGTRVGAGDRIFLGDDMWDVKFVKVIGSQPDTAKASSIFYVELLVEYGGKAKDRKAGS